MPRLRVARRRYARHERWTATPARTVDLLKRADGFGYTQPSTFDPPPIPTGALRMALAQTASAPSELWRLKEIAARLRIDIIEMLARAGSGHPGGSLSATDIVTCLFFSRMRHDPGRVDWPDRDRFI